MHDASTKLAAACGTLAYMAPEVILRHRRAMGSSADVFSLGRLSYFVVTSLLPYEGKTGSSLASMARRGSLKPLVWPSEVHELHKECALLCEQYTSAAHEGCSLPWGSKI